VLDADVDDTKQDLNVIYPAKNANVNGVITNIAPLSDIDTWRQFVENNPAGQIIETSTSENLSGTLASEVASQYASLVGGIFRTTSTTQGFQYYSNPEQWTWATQYPNSYEQTISIVNGKATLTIPSSDISALLMVQASVYFGDNDQFEMIRSDLIYNGNPIDIGEITPNILQAQGSDVTYEIGTNVTWMGNTISDNVTVSFAPSSTSCLPAVSKTDSGWAGGIFIGPHEAIEMQHSSASGCDDSWYGTVEDVDITVSYLGYQRTVTRQIEWTGTIPDITGDDQFYFFIEE